MAAAQGILANAGVQLSFLGRNLLGPSVASAIGSLAHLRQAAQATGTATMGAMGGGGFLSRSDPLEKRFNFMEPLARFADPLASLQGGIGMALQVFGWGKAAMDQAGQYQKAMELVQNMTRPATTTIADYARAIGVEGAGATGKFTGVSAQLLKETQKFVYTAPQMAQAFYSIASSGYSAGDAMHIVDLAAKDATIGGFADMATSAQALTGILKAYNVSMKDAEKYSDAFLEAIAVGKAEPADFAASMASVLPVAAAMGIKFNEVAAAIAQMTNLNFSADRSTQLLNHFLQSITNLPAASKKYALSIGLDLRPEHVNKAGLLRTVEDIRRATGDDPTKVQQLFGRNTVSKMVYNALGSGGNLASYRTDVAQVNASGGMTETTFASAMSSVMNRLGNLKAHLSVAMVQLTTSLSPLLGHVADALSVGLSSALPIVMNWVGQVKSLAHGAGAALSPLGGVLKSAFAGWPVVLAAAGHVMGALVRDIVVLGGAFVRLAVANPIVRALVAPFLAVKKVAADVLTVTVPLAQGVRGLGGAFGGLSGFAAAAAGHATTLVIPLRAAHKEVGVLASSLRGAGAALGILLGPLALVAAGGFLVRGAMSLLSMSFAGLKAALLPLRLALSGLALSLRLLATAALFPRAAFLALGLAQRRYTADQAASIITTRSGALALRLLTVALAPQRAALALASAATNAYKTANDALKLAILWVRIGDAQKMAQQIRSNVVTAAGTLVTKTKAAAMWLLAPAIGAVRLAERLATEAQIAFQAAGVRGVIGLVAQKAAALGLAIASGIARTATLAWTAVQWLLNAAFVANPLGAVILIVGLLVGAFVWAMHNTKLLSQAVGWLWNLFLDSPLGLPIRLFGLLNDKFHIVSGTLKFLGGVFGWIGGVIKSAFGGALTWVMDRVRDFAGMFGGMFKKLMGLPGVKHLLGGAGKVLSMGLGLGDLGSAGAGSTQSRASISTTLGLSAQQESKLGARLDKLAKGGKLATALDALQHDVDTSQDAATLQADAHTVADLAQSRGLGSAKDFYKHLTENIPALSAAAASSPATMNADDLGTQWLGFSSAKTTKLHAALAKAGAGGPLVNALTALDQDKNSGQDDATIKKDLATVVSASKTAGLGDPTTYLRGKYLTSGSSAAAGGNAGANLPTDGRDFARKLGIDWATTNQARLTVAAGDATNPLTKLWIKYNADLGDAQQATAGSDLAKAAAARTRGDAQKIATMAREQGLTHTPSDVVTQLTAQLPAPPGSTNPSPLAFGSGDDAGKAMATFLGLDWRGMSDAAHKKLVGEANDPRDKLMLAAGKFQDDLAAAPNNAAAAKRLRGDIDAVTMGESRNGLENTSAALWRQANQVTGSPGGGGGAGTQPGTAGTGSDLAQSVGLRLQYADLADRKTNLSGQQQKALNTAAGQTTGLSATWTTWQTLIAAQQDGQAPSAAAWNGALAEFDKRERALGLSSDQVRVSLAYLRKTATDAGAQLSKVKTPTGNAVTAAPRTPQEFAQRLGLGPEWKAGQISATEKSWLQTAVTAGEKNTLVKELESFEKLVATTRGGGDVTTKTWTTAIDKLVNEAASHGLDSQTIRTYLEQRESTAQSSSSSSATSAITSVTSLALPTYRTPAQLAAALGFPALSTLPRSERAVVQTTLRDAIAAAAAPPIAPLTAPPPATLAGLVNAAGPGLGLGLSVPPVLPRSSSQTRGHERANATGRVTTAPSAAERVLVTSLSAFQTLVERVRSGQSVTQAVWEAIRTHVVQAAAQAHALGAGGAAAVTSALRARQAAAEASGRTPLSSPRDLAVRLGLDPGKLSPKALGTLRTQFDERAHSTLARSLAALEKLVQLSARGGTVTDKQWRSAEYAVTQREKVLHLPGTAAALERERTQSTLLATHARAAQAASAASARSAVPATAQSLAQQLGLVATNATLSSATSKERAVVTHAFAERTHSDLVTQLAVFNKLVSQESSGATVSHATLERVITAITRQETKLGLGSKATTTTKKALERRAAGADLVGAIGTLTLDQAAARAGLVPLSTLVKDVSRVRTDEKTLHLRDTSATLLAQARTASVTPLRGETVAQRNTLVSLSAKYATDHAFADQTHQKAAASDLRKLVDLTAQMLVHTGLGAAAAARLATQQVARLYGQGAVQAALGAGTVITVAQRRALHQGHVYGTYQPALPGKAASFGATEVTFAPLKDTAHDQLRELKQQNETLRAQVKKDDIIIATLRGIGTSSTTSAQTLERIFQSASRAPSVSPYSGTRGHGHGPIHAT